MIRSPGLRFSFTAIKWNLQWNIAPWEKIQAKVCTWMCKLENLVISFLPWPHMILNQKEWNVNLLNSLQTTMCRTISDHCPVLLDKKLIDWHLKPFRFDNQWGSDYLTMVFDMAKPWWAAFRVEGWVGVLSLISCSCWIWSQKKWHRKV